MAEQNRLSGIGITGLRTENQAGATGVLNRRGLKVLKPIEMITFNQ
jgi:hypothetical protein